MKPVDQEFIHDPENGLIGDCQRAVLASLLDLPITEVPHFLKIEQEGGENFWCHVARFCRERGYSFVMTKGTRIVWSADLVYHAITGPSPRGNGIYHTVVGCNGKIVHDPHPSRAGLVGDPNEWAFDFLIRAHQEAA